MRVFLGITPLACLLTLDIASHFRHDYVMAEPVNPASLDALLTEATSPQRWRSRNHLAAECGFSPTALSLAVTGKRDLSDATLDALIEQTGWRREALVVPVIARPGDLETRRLVAELKRLREDVSAAVLSGTDEVARAITARNGD